jgi:hypothetical protein
MNALRFAASMALALAVTIGAVFAQSASQIRVSARMSSGVVKLGSDVRLIVQLEGANAGTISPPPAVDGLKIGAFGQASTEEQVSIGFGRQTVTRTFTWRADVNPQRTGDFTIPSITVHADGRDLATRELEFRVVEDLKGEGFGLFEVDVPTQVVEGQPFTLELRFGWDSALDQNLNYANLSLPWLGELAGLVELDAPASAPGASYVELNLNSRERIRAERVGPVTQNGRTFQVLRVRKRYIASRPGKLEFPTSHFEFGQIGERGFFDTRPPVHDTYFKRFPAFDVEVVKLPEKDRPLDFSGAVGHISAHASADRRDVDAGDSIKLAVEWTGDGNLEFFDPPDPAHIDAFKSFRVYGTTDRKAFDRRTVTYDLAPITADVHTIPPVPLRAYDPTKKAYVTIETDPIEIHVRPLKGASGLEAEPTKTSTELDIRDIQTRAIVGATPRPGTTWVVAALLGAPLAWLGARTWVRRRGDPDAPRARLRRSARKRFARELAAAKTAREQSRALYRFLAARSGESEEAWLGRDVLAWSRAEHDGVALAPDDARELADVIARLDERTYARGDESLDAAALLETADRAAKGGL